jgi:L-alanine-DL-glutamate epimerase-like enolase superfamily enzyme
MAWSVPEAVRLLTAWNEAYGIDFCEAPVRAEPVANMQEVRQKVPVALCVNEGLGRPTDVLQHIRSRTGDVLCFSSYWVGTLWRELLARPAISPTARVPLSVSALTFTLGNGVWYWLRARSLP